MSFDLSKLHIGLSRLLRYSYGGILLVLFASLFKGSETKKVIESMGAPLAVFVVVIGGAGIYVLHRSIVIPIHHLLLIAVQRFFEIVRHRKWKRTYSKNPVTYLLHLGVRPGWGIIAYSLLRKANFFANKDEINVRHAETGLLVMTSIGLFLAAWYDKCFYPKKDYFVYLLFAGIIFFVASFPPSFVQHTLEYLEIKRKEESSEDCKNKPSTLLEQAGIPMRQV